MPATENGALTETEIITAIRVLNDPAALRRIAHVAERSLQRLMRNSFRQGEKVEFDGPRGLICTGTVRSVNKRTVTVVDCVDQYGNEHVGWKVPPGELRPVGR